MIEINTKGRRKSAPKRAGQRVLKTILIQIFAWSVVGGGLYTLWYITKNQDTLFEPLRQLAGVSPPVEAPQPVSSAQAPPSSSESTKREAKQKASGTIDSTPRVLGRNRSGSGTRNQSEEGSSSTEHTPLFSEGDTIAAAASDRLPTRGDQLEEPVAPLPSPRNLDRPGSLSEVEGPVVDQAAAAEQLGLDVFRVTSEQIEIVLIPAGKYRRGLVLNDYERKIRDFPTDRPVLQRSSPSHEVTVSRSFYMSAVEITRGQFAKFADAEDYFTDAEKLGGGLVLEGGRWVVKQGVNWRQPGFSQPDDHPVVLVSWNDAVAYCKWLGSKTGENYRLPTEAEWEYACRAGAETIYAFGDDPQELTRFAWFAGNAQFRPRNSKDKRPNEWGLHGMHGNVWEWCGDYYSDYKPVRLTDPTGPSRGSQRVIRGGGWDIDKYESFAAWRYSMSPEASSTNGGFRIVLTLP